MTVRGENELRVLLEETDDDWHSSPAFDAPVSPSTTSASDSLADGVRRKLKKKESS